MSEIDDVHIDSAAAAGHCIEGGTCKSSKLPKATALGMSHDLDECIVSHQGLDRPTCRTRKRNARLCRRNRRQRHEASLSACAHALQAHIRTGEGFAFKAYLIAYTAA